MISASTEEFYDPLGNDEKKVLPHLRATQPVKKRHVCGM